MSKLNNGDYQEKLAVSLPIKQNETNTNSCTKEHIENIEEIHKLNVKSHIPKLDFNLKRNRPVSQNSTITQSSSSKNKNVPTVKQKM